MSQTRYTVLGPIDGMTVEGTCPFCGTGFNTADCTYLRNETDGTIKPHQTTCPTCSKRLEIGSSYLKEFKSTGPTVTDEGDASTMQITIAPTTEPVLLDPSPEFQARNDYETPAVGKVFNVVAWWDGNKITPCVIRECALTYHSVDVVPLTGNPHARSVMTSLLRGRIGGHPAETYEEPARPVKVKKYANADVANSLYGDRYGVDWEYVG